MGKWLEALFCQAAAKLRLIKWLSLFLDSTRASVAWRFIYCPSSGSSASGIAEVHEKPVGGLWDFSSEMNFSAWFHEPGFPHFTAFPRSQPILNHSKSHLCDYMATKQARQLHKKSQSGRQGQPGSFNQAFKLLLSREKGGGGVKTEEVK